LVDRPIKVEELLLSIMADWCFAQEGRRVAIVLDVSVKLGELLIEQLSFLVLPLLEIDLVI
jgi:hypothetical protein